MRSGHFMLGVAVTEVHSIEQRQILHGIIEAAQAEHTPVTVLSNIFNPLEPEKADSCENRIYDLILSPDLDAVIMLSESFVNQRLRARLCDLLTRRRDIPVIVVGAALPGFDFPCINTSDADDIAQITEHLVEGHGFTDIALLTGPFTETVSQVRIGGYRSVLEKHGIPFDANKVYEGDFWYNSGERLAEAFLSGEKPMPEALVCANDYMAFGVLDAFSYAGVNILDRMAVIGYEFIPERHLHTPLLTTFQRNRAALGREAVRILLRRLRGEPEQAFSPPRGRLIHGVTCSCNVSRIRQHEELVAARLNKQYADWSLKSEMERLLTECTDMEAFAEALGQFMFMIRNVADILLCLFEDWHRPESVSDVLLCRSVNPWTDHTVFRLKKNDLLGMAARAKEAAVFYRMPLCFNDRLFGYCVLRYNSPDSFDDVCRSWLKSVANGLEFLRLKADVRYLLQCRTLSVAYDSMIGIFSADGLKNAYPLMQSASETRQTAAVLLRCSTGGTLYSAEDAKPVIDALLRAARVLQQYQNGGICGRIAESDFLLLLPGAQPSAEMLGQAVTADLLAESEIGSFVCAAEQFDGALPFEQLVQTLGSSADRTEAARAERQLLPQYTALHGIRAAVYAEPGRAQSVAEYAAQFGFHTDYFNRRYKECFGLSFHQDCIRSRVLRAVHLLLHTAMTVTEVAEHCGYSESKYFIRQFAAVIGCPPGSFREQIGSRRAMPPDPIA